MEKKKVKKFRLFKNYRYLVGAMPESRCIDDLRMYNNHRFKVFTASPNVDDRPLKMNPYDYFKNARMLDDLHRLNQIDRENKDLLRKINLINRNGGKVDSFNPIAYRRMDNSSAYINKLKEIDKENKLIYRLITSAHGHYNLQDMNDDWKKTLEKIKHSCKMPYTILEKPNADKDLKACPSISEGLEDGNVDRPLCYLEFKELNGKTIGRVLIQLYYDHVPVTVQNFLEICSGNELTYKNCPVHRIVKGRFLETGDITKGNGRGGFSIYGQSFHEENHMLKHTRAGVLSMKRIGMCENNSQFCITFAPMEQLDHKNVVFGKVVKGNDVLFKIETFGRAIGKPYAEIIISKCGKV
ncbi:hypothetical protein NQ315_008719 [Exocentrus adspersus]|uniref:PPIase cyclophilin-type domain-containing protein n=1 Tax=Exocentrus adspersus TaxID=1586481 RepID=A0AAV8W6J3_9CUCU|nr:hypothetical protein NQ315_008719 [Exocentrus adspersus]